MNKYQAKNISYELKQKIKNQVKDEIKYVNPSNIINDNQNNKNNQPLKINQISNNQDKQDKQDKTSNNNVTVAQKINNVLDRYKENRTNSTPNSQSNFSDLFGVINQINKSQKQLERLQKAQENKLYKGFLKISDSVVKIFGGESLYSNYLNLFQQNLTNVGNLNQISQLIFIDATREHDNLIDLVNSSIDDSEVIYSKKINAKYDIEKITKEYEAISKEFKGLNEGDITESKKTYFELKKEKINLERQLDIISYGNYSATIDKEINNKQISNFYENMEKLYRFAVITAERIKLTSEDIRVALQNTFRVYSNFDNIYNAALACKEGLGVISEYHRTLNNDFTNGLENMVSILNNDPNMSLFKSTNPQLNKLVNDIENVQYNRLHNNELALNESG
jgi:hypothetical protein